MNTARLLGAALPAMYLTAALALTAHSILKRPLETPMTHHTPPRHRDVIEAALQDWWTTTDPTEPFHPPAAAEQVETYLISSGYQIAPDIPRNPVPTRRSITAVALITLIVIASTIATAHRGDWWWTSAGIAATALLTRELHRDLNDRRHRRNAR